MRHVAVYVHILSETKERIVTWWCKRKCGSLSEMKGMKESQRERRSREKAVSMIWHAMLWCEMTYDDGGERSRSYSSNIRKRWRWKWNALSTFSPPSFRFSTCSLLHFCELLWTSTLHNSQDINSKAWTHSDYCTLLPDLNSINL